MKILHHHKPEGKTYLKVRFVVYPKRITFEVLEQHQRITAPDNDVLFLSDKVVSAALPALCKDEVFIRGDWIEWNNHVAQVHFTIDTLNAKESEQIGRHNLKKVLENVEQLARAMPNRVTIHIVRAQTGIEDVIRWSIERELNYSVQPLQHKEDYEVVYPMWMRARPGPVEQAADRYECKYLSGSTHFYDVEGRDLPCCYIKRNADTFDRDAARQQMQSGVVPSHCTGCRQLTKVNNGNQASTNGPSYQNA